VELSWSTFVLEIINFLVLVWILKRFFYKPVLEIIARRQAGIEKTRRDAETLHAEAEKLREQFQGRLADWSKERQQAREALAREIEMERSRKLADMQSGLEQEKEKARVAETHRQADALHKVEETALLVPPKDPVAIRAAIERLLAEPDLRRDLSTKARARVERKFAWQVVAGQYVDAYQRIISGTNGDPG